MKPERWRELERAYYQYGELDEPARRAWLDRLSAEDPELKAELLALVAAETPGTRFLDPLTPPEIAELTAGAAPPERLAPSTRLGPWRILEWLAAGGMGTVYRAERADGRFEQIVAVKVLTRGAAQPTLRRRFHLERQTLASLNHPLVASLLDGGETDEGLPYLVMEYVDGRPIDRACDERRLGVEERLRLFAKVCDAVHHLHQNLIVHRDLKPSNILVDDRGRPKLLDFGIAKLLDDERRQSGAGSEGGGDHTMTGLRLMTPRFASPEQVRGEPVTTASDVYALGVLLYHLLCGRDPYAFGEGPLHELERAVCEVDPRRPSTAVRRGDVTTGGDRRPTATATTEWDTPPRGDRGDANGGVTPEEIAAARGTTVSRLRRQLAGDLDTVVLKAMAKAPADRYASAQQLADDVRNVIHHRPVTARPTPLGARLLKLARRNRAGAALTVALAISLVGGACGILWWAGRTRAESLRADREALAARQEALNVKELNRFLNDMLTSLQPGQLGVDVRVQEVLDRTAARLRIDPPGNPAVEAELHATIARSYLGLGRLDLAEEHFRRGLEVARSLYGDRGPSLAGYLTAVAEVLRYRGGLEEAEQFLDEALACFEGDPGNEHLALVEAGRAELAHARGDHRRAEALWRRVLEMRRAASGLQGQLVPESLTGLAKVLANTREDRTAEAVALLEEAIALERRRFPDDHPNVSNTRIELAFVLWRRGETRRALELAQIGLRDMSARYGEDNLSLAPALTLLGMLHLDMGAIEPAEAEFRRSLALQERAHGADHPVLAYTTSGLGRLLDAKGDFAGAADAFERALSMRERAQGEWSPTVAVAAELLGSARRRAGDDPGAKAAYERAAAIHARTAGERHPSTTQALFHLAQIEAALGDSAAAEARYRHVVDVERETLARSDPRRQDALFRLGSLLLEEGRPAEAEPLLRELVTLLEEAPKPSLDRLSLVWVRLAAALSARGDEGAAEEVLLAGQARTSALGRDSRPDRTVREALVELYRAAGRNEDAARYE